MKSVNIGLMGCGTVGTGVARLLIEKKQLIEQRVGASLVLKRVVGSAALTSSQIKREVD